MRNQLSKFGTGYSAFQKSECLCFSFRYLFLARHHSLISLRLSYKEKMGLWSSIFIVIKYLASKTGSNRGQFF